MDSLRNDLQLLYQRDLNRLIDNIEAVPEDLFWKAPEGVTNSCGVLVQHLVGNLNHFIGHVLGETEYERDREWEFTANYISKKELVEQVEQLQDTLNNIFAELNDDQFTREYPLNLPFETSTTRGFLIHLYGHLNYHLGQINYLRRIQLSDDK